MNEHAQDHHTSTIATDEHRLDEAHGAPDEERTLDFDHEDSAAMLEPLPDNEPITTRLGPADLPTLAVSYHAQGLNVSALRDLGRVRTNNQDSVFATLMHLPYDEHDLLLGLFLVADGMGGHEGGEVASRMATSVIVSYIFSHLVLPSLHGDMSESVQELMVDAMKEANHTIWNHAQHIHSDMGTTCTVALLLNQALYIAHVGDSRLYCCRDGQLELLTSDHSAVGRLIELGHLAPADALTHPMRNQLYRTIGQQPDVEVDFLYEPLGNASHIVLCSDGLWSMVSEDHIIEALQQSPWSQDICAELIARANLAGGDDNISIVVVTLPMVQETWKGQPDERRHSSPSHM